MEPLLQPLRIPIGWEVVFNDLREVDPSPQAFAESWLREDLLQLVNRRANALIDVGWYPEGDPSGEYGLVAHRGDFQGERLHQFHTPDRRLLVAELERSLLRWGQTT